MIDYSVVDVGLPIISIFSFSTAMQLSICCFSLSGIPGCAKSALCKELLNAQGGLGDDRPVHSLMGDLIKGKISPK